MAGLNNKQQVFVEAYLGAAAWNASEAARIAGYAKPGQQGHRLLKNVEIDKAIKARLSALTLSSEEVLVRLSEHARSSMADFVTDMGSSVRLDVAKALKKGKGHLIKKFSVTRQGTTIELYDAQAALALLGKHHGLFIDKVDHKHDATDEFLAAMMEFGHRE